MSLLDFYSEGTGSVLLHIIAYIRITQARIIPQSTTFIPD